MIFSHKIRRVCASKAVKVSQKTQQKSLIFKTLKSLILRITPPKKKTALL